MKTTMYILRHGATEANLASPARLLGRKQNPPLTRVGIRQAELTRDFLAVQRIDHCYSSPLLRAVQTAAIIAAPHGVSPLLLEDLNECDLGQWEGMDWQTIRYLYAEDYKRFMADPAQHGYLGGESLGQVHERVARKLDELLVEHEGQTLLIVAHHQVNRAYLAGVLGLPISAARQVSLANCGISVVIKENDATSVTTLNAAFHLRGAAA